VKWLIAEAAVERRHENAVVDDEAEVVYFVVVVVVVVVVAAIDEASPLRRQAVAGGVCLAYEQQLHVVERDVQLWPEKMRHVNPYHSVRTESDMPAIAWRLLQRYPDDLIRVLQPVNERWPLEQKC
jgi:hypothetical protein